MDPAPEPPPSIPVGPSLREAVASAVRFWERRRIAYNIVLTLLVIGWVIFTWPHFAQVLNFFTFVIMLGLAALANLCYCAAYAADMILQLQTATPASLRRCRTLLWWAGMLFALALAYYWIADEIYQAGATW